VVTYVVATSLTFYRSLDLQFQTICLIFLPISPSSCTLHGIAKTVATTQKLQLVLLGLDTPEITLQFPYGWSVASRKVRFDSFPLLRCQTRII
jgi:hypothetical protein